jgi:hypothetical protein
VNAGAASRTVMDSCCVAVSPLGVVESVSSTVKSGMPAVVGVPEIVPSGLSDSPSGSDPLSSDHAYGAVPPDPASVAEYGVPATADGKLVVVTCGWAVGFTEYWMTTSPLGESSGARAASVTMSAAG